MNSRIRTIALAGLFVSLAFVLSFVEGLFPFSVGVPGVKIGLANTVSLFVLYKLGFKEALFVSLARITLASFAFSGLFAGAYALCGALLSLTVMTLLKRTGVFSATGVSVCGAVAHNVGQLIFALFVFETGALVLYLPVLLLSGVISGAVVGLLGALALSRIGIKTK